jgi:hypothetical protein
MKLNKKAGLLTGILIIGGAGYVPSVHAQDLGAPLSLPFGDPALSNSAIAAGFFSDVWSFSVDANAVLVDTEYSTITKQVLTIPGLGTETTQSGIQLTSVELFQGSISLANMIADATIIPGYSTPVVTSIFTGTQTTTVTSYTTFLNNIPLIAGDNYILQINGENVGTGTSGYSGTLSVIPSSVPVPGAVWFMTSALAMLTFAGRKNKRS